MPNEKGKASAAGAAVDFRADGNVPLDDVFAMFDEIDNARPDAAEQSKKLDEACDKLQRIVNQNRVKG